MESSRPNHRRTVFIVVLAAVLVFSMGTALGSTEDGHGEPPPTKGWVATDTYRVMNFVVLAVALFLLLRKPISQALNGRIRAIQDQLVELEDQKKKAETELAEYNEKIAQVGKEAEKIISEYIQQGKEARDRILKEAQTAAQKIEEQARRTIEQEFKTTQERLQTGILENALTKAEEMIRSRITDDDQQKLVDEYLQKVVTR